MIDILVATNVAVHNSNADQSSMSLLLLINCLLLDFLVRTEDSDKSDLTLGLNVSSVEKLNI